MTASISGITSISSGSPASLYSGFIRVMLTSAIAASFGGASLLAWHSFAPRELQAPTSRGADFALRFSIPWIAAAIVTVILFVGVLGRGIGY